MKKNKNNLVDLRIKLDNAIDLGNMEEVYALLNEISDFDKDFIEPDDVYEFAKSVRLKDKKGGNIMKRKFNFKRTVVIAAAIVAVVGIGVSGSALFKQYNFSDGDKFYTLSADQNVDKEVLDEIEKNIKDGKTIIPPESNDKESGASVKKAEIESFSSIEEAEKHFSMKVSTPNVMPDLELKSVTGTKTDFGEKGLSEIWAVYGDINEKCFGITVKKSDLEPENYILSSTDMDKGSHDEYVSQKGYKFDKFNESNDTKEKTANIYTTLKDNYQYSFVFYNFSENEIKEIVDSFDLSE